MPDPDRAFAEPYAVRLRRICVAQIVVSVSAFTSTAVLLTCLVVVANGLQ